MKMLFDLVPLEPMVFGICLILKELAIFDLLGAWKKCWTFGQPDEPRYPDVVIVFRPVIGRL